MKHRGFVEKLATIAMVGVLVFNTALKTYGEEVMTDYQEFEVVENDVTYSIKMSEYDESTRFVVRNDANKDYSEVVINKTDLLIETTNYTYEGTNILGVDLYDEDEEEFDYGESEENSAYEPQGIVYSDSVKEKYKNDYWYAYGHGEKTDRKYLKIGCVAKYRIRTDNLDTIKKIQCDKYTTAIKNCNSKVKSGNNYASVAGVSGALILGLVIANAAFPPSVIITIVVAAVGGGGEAVKNATNAFVDAKDYFEELKDYYVIIRDYGKKL